MPLRSPSLNESNNNCFNDKKDTYRQANLMSLKDIIPDDCVECDVWDKDAINSRREQLIKFAIDQWKDL